MTYYHCSPTPGITLLKPQRFVYLTTSLPMSLMYGIKNFEYSYGYTRDGQIYFEEYFPDALRSLYGGKKASLYICAPAKTKPGRIPNEAVSTLPVPVVEEILIPDVYEALLEQERTGALVILRHAELSDGTRKWLLKVMTESILKNDLLHKPGPMADYYQAHYPESWELAKKSVLIPSVTSGDNLLRQIRSRL